MPTPEGVVRGDAPEGAARTVALVTLGCARNEFDSEELAARIGAGGWQLSDDPELLQGGVVPRYPSVPGRIRAKKAPVERVEPQGSVAGNGRLRLVLPVEEERHVEILGRGPDAAPAVVDLFERLVAARQARKPSDARSIE